MRESNAAGAKKAQLMANLSTLSRREFRTATNGQAIPQQFQSQNRYWLRLVRSGNQFSMFVSLNGQVWSLVGAQTILMNNCIAMGLVATNYTPYSTVTSTFANVSITSGGSSLGVVQAGANIGSPQPDFSIFPNPTSGKVTVDLSAYENKVIRLEVYNLQGQILQAVDMDTTETMSATIDLTRYQHGAYFLRIKTEGLPDATKRVVLQ